MPRGFSIRNSKKTAWYIFAFLFLVFICFGGCRKQSEVDKIMIQGADCTNPYSGEWRILNKADNNLVLKLLESRRREWLSGILAGLGDPRIGIRVTRRFNSGEMDTEEVTLGKYLTQNKDGSFSNVSKQLVDSLWSELAKNCEGGVVK